jgi:hypothetical protein
MIISKKNTENYRIMVHVIDGSMFATMYRDGVFIHRSEWTEEEKQLAAQAIAEAKTE